MTNKCCAHDDELSKTLDAIRSLREKASKKTKQGGREYKTWDVFRIELDQILIDSEKRLKNIK